MNTFYAPIILFVYNRPEHTRQVIYFLRQNLLAEESELFIYSDAARLESDQQSVNEVRKIIHLTKGFKQVTVIERPLNMGLARNIIDGVTAIVEQYGRVIVLEDDLETSPYFLTFMNDALETYKNEENVGNVNGHTFCLRNYTEDTFLIRFADSWGWGTWERAWKVFEPDGKKLLAEMEHRNLCNEFDFGGSYGFTKMLKRQVAGQNNSWAIRWNASLFLNAKLSINTGKSLVENIGFDGSGTHCGREHIFKTILYNDRVPVVKKKFLMEDRVARIAMARMYRWRNSKLNKGWCLFIRIYNSMLKRDLR